MWITACWETVLFAREYSRTSKMTSSVSPSTTPKRALTSSRLTVDVASVDMHSSTLSCHYFSYWSSILHIIAGPPASHFRRNRTRAALIIINFKMKKPSTRQPRTPTSSNPPPRKQNVRCKYCSRRIQYRDSLSNSVLVLNKDYIHKRCRKELDGSRPLTRLEQKHLKLHSEFVQCNLCKMIIDKSNDAMHVIKCVKHQIDTERYAQ